MLAYFDEQLETYNVYLDELIKIRNINLDQYKINPNEITNIAQMHKDPTRSCFTMLLTGIYQGSRVAIKKYKIDPHHLFRNYVARKKQFNNELKRLALLQKHPNIIELKGYVDNGNDELWIV